MTTFVGEVAEPEAPIIESIEDLMGILSPITGDGGERWYRGHRDQSWQLTASVYRSQRHRDAEQSMLARFRQEAAAVGLQHGFDGWGWLAFAQHHELPTRLLDWSQSPLIALYFACEAGEQPAGAGQEATGEFFVLNPVALNREAGDPDGHLRLLSDADQALASYVPGGDGFRQNPRAVVSPLVFDRIRFQAGTFTVEQAPRSTSDEPLRESTAVQSFAIPGESKGHIRDQLDALGFNEANIYRDLDRIAQRIKKQGGR